MQTYYIPDLIVKEYLLPNEEFTNLLNTLKLKVVKGKMVIVFKETEQELQTPTLRKICLIMQKIAHDKIEEGMFYEILTNLLLENVSFEEAILFDKQILEYKQSKAYKFQTEEEKIKNKVIELLNSPDLEKLEYFTYEQILKILKQKHKLELSKEDNRLAKILNILGYIKIRKRIEGKQQNVWVKTN